MESRTGSSTRCSKSGQCGNSCCRSCASSFIALIIALVIVGVVVLVVVVVVMCLRKAANVTRRGHVRNDEITKTVGTTPVVKYI